MLFITMPSDINEYRGTNTCSCFRDVVRCIDVLCTHQKGVVQSINNLNATIEGLVNLVGEMSEVLKQRCNNLHAPSSTDADNDNDICFGCGNEVVDPKTGCKHCQ